MGYNKYRLYYLKGSGSMNCEEQILLNFKEFKNASSIEFWDNDIDDEVWNDKGKGDIYGKYGANN